MKIALVHDDLIQKGGAEKVFLALHDIFPEAPIYTSVASDYWVKYCKGQKIDLRTSFLQKFPFSIELNRYYSPFLLHALAFESFDFSEFDLVISSSARYAHGIITKPSTTHIAYINSPGRMFWEPNQYFENEEYGVFKSLKFLARPFLAPFVGWLRAWDYVAAQRPDYVIANSKTPQERIKKYYGREAEIIYPFVDFDKFEVGEEALVEDKEKYFIIITRLAPWKRVDIAVEACKELGVKLKIIGTGPDMGRLKALVEGAPVEFLGYASDTEKVRLLKGALALINTQIEDFGIVPLEAMAAGRPVLAYGKGGVLETVIPGSTGEFFHGQTKEALMETLKKFDPSKYNSDVCKKQAKKFDRIVFAAKIKDYVLRHW
uniref:Glycosyltransferase family 4 protein n=1 Tax=candidate division WWE3 bacterium TaxID=2053526 RepID=A0A7C4XIG7_UNCKA